MGGSGIDIVGGIACRSGVTMDGGEQEAEDRLHWISRVGGSGIDIVGGIAGRSGVTMDGGEQKAGLNYF